MTEAQGTGWRFHFDPGLMGNLQTYNEEIKRIRNMEVQVAGVDGLQVPATAEQKRVAMFRLYQRHVQQYETDVESLRKQARDDFYDKQYKVFYPGQAEQDRFTRLLLDFDRFKEPEDLTHQLNRLYEVGDHTACLALLRRGVELGASSVIETFHSMYPDRQERYEQYRQAYDLTQSLEQGMPPGRPNLPSELETADGTATVNRMEADERAARESAAFNAATGRDAGSGDVAS
jgi:hypothetical protein